MIECKHLDDGVCGIASAIAQRPIKAHQKNCDLCLACDKHGQRNQYVDGLLRAANVPLPRDDPNRQKLMTYRIPRDHVPEPTSDRLVLHIGTGEKCGKELEITRPMAESYARRCGADYLCVRDKHHHRWPMASKWRAATFAARYRQTLFVDTDVVIRSDAPDLFEAVPPGAWGCVDELPSFNPPHEVFARGRSICRTQGVDMPPVRRTLNGGLILIPGESAELYRPPEKPWPNDWILDQLWLTVTLERESADVVWLPTEHYAGFIDRDFWNTWQVRPFVHFNGCGHHCTRLELMRLWRAGKYRRQEPPKRYWRPVRDS